MHDHRNTPRIPGVNGLKIVKDFVLWRSSPLNYTSWEDKMFYLLLQYSSPPKRMPKIEENAELDGRKKTQIIIIWLWLCMWGTAFGSFSGWWVGRGILCDSGASFLCAHKSLLKLCFKKKTCLRPFFDALLAFYLFPNINAKHLHIYVEISSQILSPWPGGKKLTMV